VVVQFFWGFNGCSLRGGVCGVVRAGAIDDLIKFYQMWFVFFPPTVETFGNNLVEAMACGTTIASLNAAAMHEALGDAGLYFDPNKISDMRNSISQLAEARSHKFSWKKTEAKT
jgi:glycosyltransferase involved in cell wall biosynthesis